MKSWQLQEAKARLSDLVKSAQREGPQEISVRGKPVVVVLSKSAHQRLTGRKLSFVEFMRRSPLVGAALKIERDKSPDRPVAL